MRFPSFRRGGFTLVELLIVVIILGILAAIIVPSINLSIDESQCNAELANVKIIFDAAAMYAAEHDGTLPGDGFTGKYPGDFEGYLRNSIFINPTPAGGLYDWNGPIPWADDPSLRIVFPVGTDVASLKVYKMIESAVDDGVANTGWVRVAGKSIKFCYQ